MKIEFNWICLVIDYIINICIEFLARVSCVLIMAESRWAFLSQHGGITPLNAFYTPHCHVIRSRLNPVSHFWYTQANLEKKKSGMFKSTGAQKQ